MSASPGSHATQMSSTLNPTAAEFNAPSLLKTRNLLRITLMATENPPISRLIAIPTTYTCHDLHRTICVCFNWSLQKPARFEIHSEPPVTLHVSSHDTCWVH